MRLLGILLVLSAVCHTAAAQTITTIAGRNALSYNSANALTATFGAPHGVTIGPGGDVYFGDGRCRVHKLAPATGLVTTVAGNGDCGYSGDGGPATQARLNFPRGLAFDPAGNLYIADSSNNRIRRVSAAGVIVTFAGTGDYGSAGDGVQATLAQFAAPAAIARDSNGTFYVADHDNAKIRAINSGGVVSTFAGTGSPGFSGDGGPAVNALLSRCQSVAVDASNNVYIADSQNSRVRRVATNGTITTAVGTGQFGYAGDGGQATAALLSAPRGLFVDGSSNLFIADALNQVVRRVTPGGVISTIAGTGGYGFRGDGGPATAALLSIASWAAADTNGNVYIADSDNNRLRRVAPNGTISTVAGSGSFSFSGDTGVAINAEIASPFGSAVDGSGNVYIADSANHRVRKIAPNGVITTLAGTGAESFSGDGGPAVNAALSFPTGVVADGQGNVYIADSNNSRVRRVNAGGTISTFAGNGTPGNGGDGGLATAAQLITPDSLALDAAGVLYIVDRGGDKVRKVGTNGVITLVAGTGVAGFSGDGGQGANAQLDTPRGVAVDGAFNVYIGDTLNNRVRRVTAAGIITTFAGTGAFGGAGNGGQATAAQLGNPEDIAVDSTGKVYIADTQNARIQLVAANGIVTTFAGDGTSGFRGDGGPAVAAWLRYPHGVAVDAAGSVYIADTENHRIRKVSGNAISVLTPADGQIVGVQNVTFSWTSDAAASGYDLRVVRAGDGQAVFTGQLLGANSTSTVINLPTGAFQFQVAVCTGSQLESCGNYIVRNFTVQPVPAPGIPQIVFPTAGAVLTTSTHELRWTAVTAATLYELTLRNITAGTVDLFHTVLPPSLNTVFSMRGGQYSMEVRACNVLCSAPATVSFTVQLPPVPTAAPAVSGCTVTNDTGQNRLDCNWSAISGADLYILRVVQPPPAGPGGGALTVASRQVSATTASVLVPNGNAVVFVQACNGDGCGPNSPGTGVNPAFGNPAIPLIGEPVSGLTVDGPTVLFTWNRIPGDTGSGVTYRVYVQDFARQQPALDVLTTQNFWAAQFAAGRRYDALIIAQPLTASPVVGQAQGFTTRGNSPFAPTLVQPQHQGSLRQGNVRLGWTPLPGAQLYQYYISRQGSAAAAATGVTTGLEVQVPLTAVGGQNTSHTGIVRVCQFGSATCTASSETGWGPWSNTAGGTGVTNFTITP